MDLLFSTFLLFFITCRFALSNVVPLKHTTTGSLSGIRHTVLGKDVDLFLGIPYAQPPINELRFRRPERVKSWSGTRNATKFPPACYQEIDDNFNMFDGVKMWNANTGRDEDCLYLNIWQPVGGRSNKATMIWIFGGSYSSGSATLDVYNGAYLAVKGDVIVVSLQYRIGPFGFLFLKGAGSTDAAPGNMGLLDQSLAIQWYSDNAETFGGDKNRITLFGESAGAASVNYQMISALTKNRFKSAIMQSATALSPWAYDTPEVAQTKALELARLVNCKTGNLTGNLGDKERKEIIECLRKVSSRQLSEHQFNVNDSESLIVSAFVPTLDDYFITQPPLKAITALTEKPIMAGVNKDEGVYFLAYMQQDLFPVAESVKPLSRTDFDKGIRDILKLDKEFVLNSVAFEYLWAANSSGGSPDYRDILDDILGDPAFKCAVVQLADLHADAGKDVYLYEFNHRTSANDWPQYMGVMHGYEIDHVFGLPFNNSLKYRPEEKTLSEEMVTYWSNFAKTGNPNQGEGQTPRVQWPAYKSTDRMVISLNTNSIYAKRGIRERACEFWRKVVPKLREAGTGVIECRSSILQLSLSSLILSFVLFTLLTF